MSDRVNKCKIITYVDKTLAIIKPDAIKYADVIEDIILRTGFSIINRRRVHMTPEQASDFYSEHFGKMFFTKLVEYMSQGPIICLILSRDHAINTWEELMGPSNTLKAQETYPDSIRAVHGIDDMQNAVHGSENQTCAEREIKFFFPDSIPDTLMSPEAMDNYMAIYVNPTLLKGITQLCKVKPLDPVTWLANWLTENNPNKPQVKYN